MESTALIPPGIRPDAGASSRALLRDRTLHAVVAVTALAAVVRFATIGLQSYWYDEAVTALRVLRPSFGGTLSAYYHSESTPPLYYVLAWGWSRVAGTGEVGLRSLSALIGTLTVPASYAVGAVLVSRRTGLALAALAAVSPLLVWYSQEARAYALAILLVTTSLWCLGRATADPSAVRLAMWALTAGLAVASHYFAAFPVAGEAAWLVLALGRETRRRAAAAVAGTTAIAAALVPLALHQTANGHTDWIRGYPVVDRLVAIPRMLLMGPSIAPYGKATLLAVAPVGLGLAFLLTRTDPARRRQALIAGAVGMVAIVLPLLLAAGGADYLAPRNTVVAWPALMLAPAAGLAAARAGRPGRIALGTLLAVSLAVVVAVATLGRLQRPDWRGAAQVLQHSARARAVLTPALGTMPLQLYLAATPLGARTVRVGEVDVLSWERSGSRVRAPLHGLRRVAAARRGTLTITRFVARRPLAVSRATLARRSRAKVLVTRAGGAVPPAPSGAATRARRSDATPTLPLR